MPRTKAKARSSTSSSLVAKPFPSSKASAPSAKPQPKAKPAAQKGDGEQRQPADLDPFDTAWSEIYKDSKKRMGRAVHGETLTPVDVILRIFDTEDEWGPAVNISRLERWERAEKMGLQPPPEVGQILKTHDGRTKDQYRKSVFNL